jgi:hypothetical protein
VASATPRFYFDGWYDRWEDAVNQLESLLAMTGVTAGDVVQLKCEQFDKHERLYGAVYISTVQHFDHHSADEAAQRFFQPGADS